MFNLISTRLAAFGLATVVTLTMLSGIDTLAFQQHAATSLAKAKAAQQVVATASQRPQV